jgi:hypothetical protein
MPNWCANTTTFTHEDPAQVARLIKAFNESKLFNEFVTCPPALHESVEIGENYNERNEAKEAANREEYGFSSWYDWNVTHWGTKWDVGEESDDFVQNGESDGNSVTLTFDSAWSPPIAFYEAMTDLGWKIKGYYYEPGMAFCGLFDDSVNEEYSIDGDSNWVVDHIPSSIDEMFAISENMEIWEEEEQMSELEELTEEDEEEFDTEEKSGPDAGC